MTTSNTGNLTSEQRQQLVSGWRAHIQNLPSAARSATLATLTREYGPDFASEVVQPETVKTTPTVMPIGSVTQPPMQGHWWDKVPVIKQVAQDIVEPITTPALKALDWENRKWITPAAMTVGQVLPQVRQQLGGRQPFAIPEQERQQLWKQTNLPWLAKTGIELAVDPLSYVGWGIPGALETKAIGIGERTALEQSLETTVRAGMKGASEETIKAGIERASKYGLQSMPEVLNKAAQETGYGAAAKLLHPMVQAEKAFNVVAEAPFKAVGGAIRSTKAGEWLLSETKKSIVGRMSLHTADAFNNLATAGDKLAVKQPLSQTLDALMTGKIDESTKTLLNTITNPQQKVALSKISEYAQTDEGFRAILNGAIKKADKTEYESARIVGESLKSKMAKELGLRPNVIDKGTVAKTQQVLGSIGNLWKRMVLNTPWYPQQVFAENAIRQIMVGTNPFFEMADIVARADFKEMPLEIQRKGIGIMEGMHAPTAKQTILERTASMGSGPTESTLGLWQGGWYNTPANFAQGSDRHTVMGIFFPKYTQYVKELLEATSPETAKTLSQIRDLGEGLKKSGVEPLVADHLVNTALNGSSDTFLQEMQKIQKNKTLTIARPINDAEQSVAYADQQYLKQAIPAAWYKNDANGINKAFDKVVNNIPQRVSDYQEANLIRRAKAIRDQIVVGYSPEVRSLMRNALKRASTTRVAEYDAEMLAAKSAGALSDARFEASLGARQEIEDLSEGLAYSEMLKGNAGQKEMAKFYDGKAKLTADVRTASASLRNVTREASETISRSKNATKIQEAWTKFIQEIQSIAPEQASILVNATPDTELLWNTYFKVQERRWWNHGQDIMELAGIPKNTYLSAINPATGKALTQEDFIQEQIGIVNGWRDRAIEAFDKRAQSSKPLDMALDNFREQTLKALDGISLQHQTIKNQAKDMALNDVRSTFGHYAIHSNLDEIMTKIIPFWYFPSRSLPFYARQMITKPRLGIEMYNIQKQMEDSTQPNNLFGYIQIAGTGLWYNPLRVSHLFKLATESNYTPADFGSTEGASSLLQKVGIGLGPQFAIAESLVGRALGKKMVEPEAIIPQQVWLKAIAHLDLPGLSQVAGIVNEPFDGYLRAVYGNDIADYQLREVEKYMVDAGLNPAELAVKSAAGDATATAQIQAAWKRYYIRQLASIPFGTLRSFTQTEQERLDAINKKVEAMGISPEQQAAYRAAGESPLVGMRQDQIDAFYSDIPAEKLVKYIRPANLTPESAPYWDDYVQLKIQRQDALDARIAREQQLDTQLQTNKITPREWKALYRTSYQTYVDQVGAFEKDYPKAMKTEADWTAFKNLIGSTISPRNPDDIALDNYYTALDTSNGQFDNPDVPGEFDYAKYRTAEQQFLSTLSKGTQDYINSRKNKYKTPLRVAYTQDMAKAQPYYDIGDAVLSQFPVEVQNIINYAMNYPDPAIQKTILSRSPTAMLALRRVSQAKAQFLVKNPSIAQILRYWNT